jgi:ATP-dependent protease HslVU (ClpYQ) peptidase subunit
MTTIIGMQGEDFAVICADSRISEIDDGGIATQFGVLKDSSAKMALNGRYLLGAAGDLRAINLLHHAFTPPVCPPNLRGKKLDHFITVKFIPALRECFEAQGYASPDNDEKQHIAEHGSAVVAVINGTIYIIDGDYSWISDVNGVYAVGTGAQYALGALHALTPRRSLTLNTARKIAVQAVAAAAKFDPHTGAPYHTFVQGQEKTKTQTSQGTKRNTASKNKKAKVRQTKGR